jgi:hypothetical protein
VFEFEPIICCDAWFKNASDCLNHVDIDFDDGLWVLKYARWDLRIKIWSKSFMMTWGFHDLFVINMESIWC